MVSSTCSRKAIRSCLEDGAGKNEHTALGCCDPHDDLAFHDWYMLARTMLRIENHILKNKHRKSGDP